jgi:glutamate N-acetyltransferase/amino-acid N-acetyltransferase
LKETSHAELTVAGFTGTGVSAGIRKDGREDLALITAEKPVPVAGVFTQSPLAAAPVQVAKRHIRSGRARAILANSGCANAATGQAGLAAAENCCQKTASALGCLEQEVLPCSTGVIGQLLDAEKIGQALPKAVKSLSAYGLGQAAGAIMTTDAFAKTARQEITIKGKPVVVSGLAKGAGMIRPDMATMLAFILTDANVDAPTLEAALRISVGWGFNRISVDGDTSTNDTCLLMASGKAQNPEITADDPEFEAFAFAVTKICQDLAAMMVADGEGSGHLIRVRTTGATDQEAARQICYAISHSLLCKTAFAGCDPNWGRFLSTAAIQSQRMGRPFYPEKTRITIGNELLVKSGVWTGEAAEEKVAKIMKQDRYELHLDLGLGEYSFWVLTSDLDHKYIEVNADYRS